MKALRIIFGVVATALFLPILVLMIVLFDPEKEMEE